MIKDKRFVALPNKRDQAGLALLKAALQDNKLPSHNQAVFSIMLAATLQHFSVLGRQEERDSTNETVNPSSEEGGEGISSSGAQPEDGTTTP